MIDQPSMSTRPASTFMPMRCCPASSLCGSSGGAGFMDATSNDFCAGAGCCAGADATPTQRTTSQLATPRTRNLRNVWDEGVYSRRSAASGFLVFGGVLGVVDDDDVDLLLCRLELEAELFA